MFRENSFTAKIESPNRKELAMKTCPICNANTFDDMDVCYGCMFEFKNDHNYFKTEELDFSKDQSHEMTPLFIYDKVRQECDTLYTPNELWEFMNYRNALLREFSLRKSNAVTANNTIIPSTYRSSATENTSERQARCYQKFAQSIGFTMQLSVDKYTGEIQVENITTVQGKHAILPAEEPTGVITALNLEA